MPMPCVHVHLSCPCLCPCPCLVRVPVHFSLFTFIFIPCSCSFSYIFITYGVVHYNKKYANYVLERHGLSVMPTHRGKADLLIVKTRKPENIGYPLEPLMEGIRQRWAPKTTLRALNTFSEALYEKCSYNCVQTWYCTVHFVCTGNFLLLKLDFT
jgi:hypothetical protein